MTSIPVLYYYILLLSNFFFLFKNDFQPDTNIEKLNAQHQVHAPANHDSFLDDDKNNADADGDVVSRVDLFVIYIPFVFELPVIGGFEF